MRMCRVLASAACGRASSSLCRGSGEKGLGGGGRGRAGRVSAPPRRGKGDGLVRRQGAPAEVMLLPLPGRGSAPRRAGADGVARRGRGGVDEGGSQWLAEGWARGAQALDAAVDLAADALPEDVDRSVVEIAVRGGAAAAVLNAAAAVLASAAGVGTAIVGGTVLASELARKGASADTSLGAASYIAQAVAGLAKDAADPSRKKMPRPRRR